MKKINKTTIIWFILLILTIINIALAYDQKAVVDQEVLDSLNNKGRIHVTVLLKDIGNRTNFRNEILEGLNNSDIADIRKGQSELGWFSLEVSQKSLEKLRENPHISMITYPKMLRTLLTESVPQINADFFRNSTFNGTGVTVCIIDSGINATHPDLIGKVIAQTCFCRISNYGLGGCCPNNSTQDSNAIDDSGHGTLIAGIIAANGTVKGVALGAKLAIVKACNASGNCHNDDVADGINWCRVVANASIISISLGDGKQHTDRSICDNDTHSAEINLAVNNGVFVAVAAGNNASKEGLESPACASGATSVGMVYDDFLATGSYWPNTRCTDQPPAYKDSIPCESNKALFLDLLAPGVRITSTSRNGGTSTPPGGSSWAAPHVAGAAAILQSAYNNSLRPNQIEWALNSSGKPVWDSRVQVGVFPWEKGKYFSRIDVLAAFDYLSYYTVANNDWPTDHHDFHRTGFTFLKGDLIDQDHVDDIPLALKANMDTDVVIRPSVSDLDNNGRMDVVTVMHDLVGANHTYIYDVERYKKFGIWWTSEQKWSVVIDNVTVLLPPTLAHIDNFTDKEILVGARNGSVMAFTIRNGSAILKWQYQLPKKTSPSLGGGTFVDMGGGSAVTDLDLDNIDDIIFTDFGSRTLYDWPGELVVLTDNGDTALKKYNATFGNGGAFASVSVANIDSDDNPEIIVPSFYGVFVYDYNATYANGLRQRCNTTSDGGLLDGSVVVFDIDRDGNYELVYVAVNKSCSPDKACSNRLYIKDAKTCSDKGISPVSLDIFPRVTPAIGNLDSNNNPEIVISGTYTQTGELGEVECYDAITGNKDCSYNNGNTLKVSFVSPDIADIDSDGHNDIIFGEDNGTKVHIVRPSTNINFTYDFEAFIDSALAIADIDGDGKAEIALKRGGSPIDILSFTSGFNHPPELNTVTNLSAVAGDLINLNRSGEVYATDEDGNALNFTFSAPFNNSGLWQTTVNDTGNYSILIQVSDGNLSVSKTVNVYVFSQYSSFVGNFSDGTSFKSLNFTQAANKTIYVRIPKNASILYSTLKVEGFAP